MAIKEIAPLKPTSNDVLMDAIRNDLSTDYQNRIPKATQAGIRETAQNLLSYKPAYNEFVDALVNRIGQVIVRNTSWSNPLSLFKRGLLEFGDTIEEIQTGLIKARTYDQDREHLERDIFGHHPAPTQANFHSINDQRFYPITVNDNLLRRAFLTTNGIQEFISGLLAAPMTSDQWDEFLLMCSLFSQYEANGGYYHVNVPDLRSYSSDESDAKMVAKKVRAMAQNLTFMSSKYNAARMPSHVATDDLVLFGTPEFFAAQDVDALAAAFNMDRATLAGRQVAIPAEQFNMPGAQAILTSQDFFVVADSVLENTSADNPVGMHRNYFLHHHQVISNSRFVPAVLFHTGHDDESITVSEPVTGISAVTTFDRDGTTAKATFAPGDIGIAKAAPVGNDKTAVYWEISGGNDPRTRITQNGTIHIGPSEDASSVKVTATTTWIDPADPNNTTAYSASKSLTVSGETLPEWPRDHTGETEPDPAG